MYLQSSTINRHIRIFTAFLRVLMFNRPFFNHKYSQNTSIKLLKNVLLDSQAALYCCLKKKKLSYDLSNCYNLLLCMKRMNRIKVINDKNKQDWIRRYLCSRTMSRLNHINQISVYIMAIIINQYVRRRIGNAECSLQSCKILIHNRERDCKTLQFVLIDF